MKKVKFYSTVSVRTLVIQIYYVSGTVTGTGVTGSNTVIIYGSGSAKAKSYGSNGSGSASLPVTQVRTPVVN
jgi:hypothetical protein